MTYLKTTVYLYSMNDLYKKNRPSRQPMAIRKLGAMSIEANMNDMWLDRLRSSMYIVLTGTLFTISLALVLGFNF